MSESTDPIEFSITFGFESSEHLDNATLALSAHYGFDASSKEDRRDFVKRKLLTELQERVVRQMAQLASQSAWEAAHKPAQEAAASVTVK